MPPEQAEGQGEPSGSSTEVRVLLVEDDLDHAKLIEMALPHDDGFRVTHVRTGARALELVGREEFQVCLVDYRLPDHDGVKLCGEVREHFDGPLLLITSVARESAVQRAFEMGADDYLVKDPALMSRLPAEIRRHLQERRA